MRFGVGTAHFDLTDVDQTYLLERTCLHLREARSRAFARGFTAALEGEASGEWSDYYREKRW